MREDGITRRKPIESILFNTEMVIYILIYIYIYRLPSCSMPSHLPDLPGPDCPQLLAYCMVTQSQSQQQAMA